MTQHPTKSQIDRLGDRLRRAKIDEADLRLLDDYRRSFGDAYELVVGSIRNELGLQPTDGLLVHNFDFSETARVDLELKLNRRGESIKWFY